MSDARRDVDLDAEPVAEPVPVPGSGSTAEAEREGGFERDAEPEREGEPEREPESEGEREGVSEAEREGEPELERSSEPQPETERSSDPEPVGPGADERAPAASGDDEHLLVHRTRLPSIIESLLLAADRPLSAADIAALVEEPRVDVIEGALALLEAEWAERGIQLHLVAGGWQLRTNTANAAWVQKLVAQKPVRLSRPLLETLAIVAYRQPITRPEIDEIRGVDSGGTLKTLLERSLIRILGKKEEPGRPLLYGTTREFLEFFNLPDLKELPTLREFHELSDEHRAQVEALEHAAPPGAVENRESGEPAPPPLVRVELSDAPIDEDLSGIDSLIREADARAQAATAALGSAGELTPPDPSVATPPSAETPVDPAGSVEGAVPEDAADGEEDPDPQPEY